MTISTVTVSITVSRITGVSMASAVVRFELTGADIDGGVVGPQATSITLDANGLGSVQLWPNSASTQGTQYRVTIFNSSQDLQFAGLATVPNSACNLHDVLNLAAPPVVDDAEAAALAAQAYAASAYSAATTAIADYIAAHPTTGGTQVVEESPTGTIDGVNTDFTIAYTPLAGTFKLFMNGLRMKRGTDYTQTGTAFSYLYAPASGAIHFVDYEH